MIRQLIPNVILLIIGATLCTTTIFMKNTVRAQIREERADAVMDFIEQQPIQALLEIKIDNLPRRGDL